MDVRTSHCVLPTERLVKGLDRPVSRAKRRNVKDVFQLKLALPCESQPDHFRVSSGIRSSSGVCGTSSKVLTRIFLMDYGYQGMAEA